ncbi:TetR/AcrR family transcriptional regulator [Intestinibacter sp.]
MNKERKIDRRTQYTKNVIKEAVVELSKKKAFDKITVTEVCKVADINRGTFYLHYLDLYNVVDEILDEVLENTSSIFEHLNIQKEKEVDRCTYPLCKMFQENKKYESIFFNDFLTSYIINKIVEKSKDNFITEIKNLSNVTDEVAYAILVFQMNGCFAVNKSINKGNKKWCETQFYIDKFIEGGLKNIIKYNETKY